MPHAVQPCGRTAGKKSVGPEMAVFRPFPRGKKVLETNPQKVLKNGQNGVYSDLGLVLKISFSFFFASASSALYLSTEPNYSVIVNAVPPKQKIAQNRRDTWDRGSMYASLVTGIRKTCPVMAAGNQRIYRCLQQNATKRQKPADGGRAARPLGGLVRGRLPVLSLTANAF